MTHDPSSHSDLLSRARDLGEQFKDFADEADNLRRVPDGALEAIVAADLSKAMAPRSHGGYEVDWLTYTEINRHLTRHSGSIGWCASFLINHLWFLHFFNQQTIDAVYAAQPGTPRIVTSFAPFGKARKVPGGYQVEGAWPFGSGGNHCDWAIVGAPKEDFDGTMLGLRVYLLRKDQFEMQDSWYSVGLRGSGSNTIVVKETFVEEAWTLDMALAGSSEAPGNFANDSYIFKHSVPVGLTLGIVGAVMGTARSAMEDFIEFNRNRKSTYRSIPVAQAPTFQIRLGQSATEIDASMRIIEYYDTLARAGKLKDAPLEFLSDMAYVAGILVNSVDRLFESAGARGLSEKLRLQRCWRDIHAMSNHAVFDRDSFFQLRGMIEMGLLKH